MTADSKLLSVCIPTYNGAKYIGHNIDIIIEQIKKFDLSGVEIVVSDNCSTDNIPEIMKKYVETYPDIVRYSRNEKNLGYDGNVMKLCSIAQGRFIHLFGDDDFYSPSGLKRLYDVLKQNQDISVAVLSNSYLRQDYFDQIVFRQHLNTHFYVEDKHYINDSDNFIIDIEDRAWPNTNLVFRSDYFREIPDLERFYKTDWIHLYILLYIAQKHQNCYLFADKAPIVIDRVGVQKWLNNIDGPRIYFNNLWTYSFADELGYSPKVFEWYRKKLLSEYIKYMRYRRSHSFSINLKYISKYFKYYKDLPSFYFKFIPKFLKPLQTIFSIENEVEHAKKKKIITFLGKRFVVLSDMPIRELKFIHKLRDDELVMITNSNGNYKQFVKNSVYKEMYDMLNNLKQYAIFSNRFYKKIQFKYLYKKLIPYSMYLANCEEFAFIIKYTSKRNKLILASIPELRIFLGENNDKK